MKMSKKITAVIWLIEQLEQKGFDIRFNQDIIQKAKQIEKEQIVEAYTEGFCNGISMEMKPPKQYYSETYE